MTQEEKQLLLQDLSARLPYGVKGKTLGGQTCTLCYIGKDGSITADAYYCWIGSKQFIPYLRPMLSMTEEEKEELLTLLVGKDAIDYFQIENNQITNTDEHIQFGPSWQYHWINFSNENISLYVDWLNKHHFDYRGLIPRGLALEAPEGMYTN